MEIAFTRIYIFYTSVLLKSLRFLLLFFILAVVYNGVVQNYFPKYAVFFLIWFVILEIFMHFKIGKVNPKFPVTENTGDKLLSSTQSVLRVFISSPTPKHAMTKLNSLPEATFFLERMGVTQNELKPIDISQEELLNKAVEIVKEIKKKYLTPPDILAAYLLLTEDTTKLLFSRELKKNDLLNIVLWTRSYWKEEEEKVSRVTSGGFADALVTGWTPETLNYTRDITFSSFQNNPQITGREEEFKRIIETLQKTNSNNVLLIGEPGSGKENLIELLAVRSQLGLLPPELDHKKIIELLIGPLIAGASDKGELEERIQAVIAEVSHAGNVILVISELQNILGSSSYGMDLSGVLLPYLNNGNLPIIATISKGNYKTYFEKNPLRQVFEQIPLEEPSLETALQMLFQKTATIEETYHVILTYNAIFQAVKLSDRYFPDTTLPGSAVALLEDVANTSAVSNIETFAKTGKRLITPTQVIKKIQEKTHIAVASPTEKEKELLLHLEDKLHERVIDQHIAVKAIAESLRRLRVGLSSSKKPISFLFLGPTGVGKTETARALGDIYFGGEEHILRLDMSEYTNEDGVERLLGASPGQGEERGELTDKIHDHPSSLILLDEFEKANPLIRDLFLQVLEDGRLTDNKGRTVSFLNAIIIATSNAGSEFIREELQKGTPVDKTFQHKLLNYLQEKSIFRPELLNRFDDVVVFKPLTKEAVKEIVKILLKKMTKTLEEQDIIVTFDDSVIEKIATEGEDTEFGARPLLRYIQDNIEDIIAQEKLKDQIIRGDKIRISLDQTGAIKIIKESVA